MRGRWPAEGRPGGKGRKVTSLPALAVNWFRCVRVGAGGRRRGPTMGPVFFLTFAVVFASLWMPAASVQFPMGREGSLPMWPAQWSMVSLFTYGPGIAHAQSFDEPDHTPISLPNILVPEVGYRAVFLNRELLIVEAEEWSGVFAAGSKDVLETLSSWAVLAEYTVLEPDPISQHPRLYVRAAALNPHTHEPLLGEYWEGEFHLDEAGAVLMSDIFVPEQYAPLVAPAWLAGGWSLTPIDQLPQGTVAPGHRWQAVSDSNEPVGNWTFSLPQVAVEGTFVGWTGSSGDYYRAAVVEEAFSGDGHTVDMIDGGLPAHIHYAVEGEQLYYLVPDDFPESATRTFDGFLHVAAGSESDAEAGSAGEVTLSVYFERSYVKQPVGPFPWPPHEPVSEGDHNLFPSVPVYGNLGVSGEELNDGTYVEYYAFFGEAEDRVEIRLQSTVFDAYLFLANDDWNVLAEDDDSGGGTNAVIRYVLPYDGTYHVAVNSPVRGETGAYLLTLDRHRLADLDWSRATQLITRMLGGGTVTWAELREIEWYLWQSLDRVDELYEKFGR